MGRIYRGFLRDVVVTFFFVLSLIAIFFAITQLTKFARFLVTFGVSFENIAMLFLLYFVQFLPFLVPLALAFSMTIVFARLSSQGEYVAYQASGCSLVRLVGIALIFLVPLQIATMHAAVHLESWSSRQNREFIVSRAQTEIDNIIGTKIAPGTISNDFLGYSFYTEEISEDRKELRNVIIAPKRGAEESFMVFAPRGSIKGSAGQGNLTLELQEGTFYSNRDDQDSMVVMRFDKNKLNLTKIFESQLSGNPQWKESVFQAPFGRLKEIVETKPPDLGLADYTYAQYLLHSRFANTLLVFSSAFFGIVAGIFDDRRNKNRALFKTVFTTVFIFSYVNLAGWIVKQNWASAAPVVWGSQVSLFIVSAVLLLRRSHVPPAESLFSLPRSLKARFR